MRPHEITAARLKKALEESAPTQVPMGRSKEERRNPDRDSRKVRHQQARNTKGTRRTTALRAVAEWLLADRDTFNQGAAVEDWSFWKPLDPGNDEGSGFEGRVRRWPDGGVSWDVTYLSVNGGESTVAEAEVASIDEGKAAAEKVMQSVTNVGLTEDDLASEGAKRIAGGNDITPGTHGGVVSLIYPSDVDGPPYGPFIVDCAACGFHWEGGPEDVAVDIAVAHNETHPGGVVQGSRRTANEDLDWILADDQGSGGWPGADDDGYRDGVWAFENSRPLVIPPASSEVPEAYRRGLTRGFADAQAGKITLEKLERATAARRTASDFASVQPGLLPAGTVTPYGTIVSTTLTAYEMDDGNFVAFEKVHGKQPPAEPLVQFGGRNTMNETELRQREAELLRAMAVATPEEQVRLYADLDAVRAQQDHCHTAAREVDLGATEVLFAPRGPSAHSPHTAQTDWMAEVASGYETPPDENAVRTEAAQWWRRTSDEVKADREEFWTQARGIARRTASQYGTYASLAHAVFLDHLSHLHTQHLVLAEPTQYGPDVDPAGSTHLKPTSDDVVTVEEGVAEGPLDNFAPERYPGNPEVDPTSERLLPGSPGKEGRRRFIGQQGMGRRRTAADGQTCADCGATIERDPAGETNRTWHHADGASHDHEAKPAGGSGEDKQARRTATRYCKTHQVWIGEGNAANHDAACKIEERKTESSRRVAVEGTDVCSKCGDAIYNEPGVGWVSAASGDQGGTYDLCDAGGPHTPASKESSLTPRPDDQFLFYEAADESVPETGEPAEKDKAMWPWELNGDGKQTDAGAADVAGVPTPGQSEADYPQPSKKEEDPDWPIKNARQHTSAGTFRIEETVGASSGKPFFTLQYMGGEESFGYGVWEDVTSSYSKAELESFVASPPAWFGDTGATLASRREAVSPEFQDLMDRAHQRAQQIPVIDSAGHPFTLVEGDEDWIGYFTDRALQEMEGYWSSPEGQGLQEYMPGGAAAYADNTLKLIRDERTRRGTTGARRTAAGYSPVPGEPFRWLDDPQRSPEDREYRELFPNGVPMTDEAMSPEQLAYWRQRFPQGERTSRRQRRFAVLSNNCLNGNHSDCTGSSCSCSCHKTGPKDYSGACAAGDHASCKMSHGTGPDDCQCPVCRNKTASRRRASSEEVQAMHAGWPKVPSLTFPGETTLSCPQCGSTSIEMGADWGPGGRMGDSGATSYIRCKGCGYITRAASGPLMASRRTAGENPFAKKEEKPGDKPGDKPTDNKQEAQPQAGDQPADDVLAAVRAVAESGQPGEAGGQQVDAQTAQAIVSVYDNLSPDNQAVMASMDIAKMSDIAVKLQDKVPVDTAIQDPAAPAPAATAPPTTAQRRQQLAFRARVQSALAGGAGPRPHVAEKQYKSQCARDAQRFGYGDERYWDELDEGAQRHYDYFMARGDTATAEEMLTRSLSQALMGNEGD